MIKELLESKYAGALEQIEELGKLTMVSIDDGDLTQLIAELENEGYECEVSPDTDYLICTKCSRKLSLDNGVHFVDMKNPTEAEKEKIQDYWEAITNFMDVGDAEKVNDITSVDTTDTIDDKIQYLKDYLNVAKNDLILG